MPVGWEHVDFAAHSRKFNLSLVSARIPPSYSPTKAESDAHKGEENAEDEQKSG